MKWATLVIIALVGLLTCAQTLAAVTSNVSIPLNDSILVPCANGGAGENVTLSGPLHIVSSVTITKDTARADLLFNPQDVRGVGSVTGNAYKATGVTRDDITMRTMNGSANSSYVNNFRLIGQGRAPNFLVHETLHFTVNANGSLTASRDRLSADCRL